MSLEAKTIKRDCVYKAASDDATQPSKRNHLVRNPLFPQLKPTMPRRGQRGEASGKPGGDGTKDPAARIEKFAEMGLTQGILTADTVDAFKAAMAAAESRDEKKSIMLDFGFQPPERRPHAEDQAV